jgi:hypothetical protein
MAPRALQKPAKQGPTRANASRRGHNLTWYDPTNQRLATTDQEFDPVCECCTTGSAPVEPGTITNTRP